MQLQLQEILGNGIAMRHSTVFHSHTILYHTLSARVLRVRYKSPGVLCDIRRSFTVELFSLRLEFFAVLISVCSNVCFNTTLFSGSHFTSSHPHDPLLCVTLLRLCLLEVT